MRRAMLIVVVLVVGTLGAVPALAQGGDAHLRVAHFSVDAGAVDIYVNGEAALTGVAFGTVSDWMLVPPGAYSLAVAPAGTSIEEAVIGPLDASLDADGWYTVAAIGLAEGEDIAPLTAQIIVEDYSDLALGQARLTIFHAIPNTAPVSVVANDNLVVAGLAYPNVADENDGLTTVSLDAGSYDIEVTLTDAPDTTVFDLEGVEIGAQRNVFIAATGLIDNPELVFVSTNPADVDGEMMAEDTPSDDNAHLRVGHFGEDAPAVDVYINGELSSVTGVDYPALSPWMEVAPGTYSVAVAPAGTALEEAVIGPVDVTVEAGEWYTVAAVGLLGDESLTAQVLVEDYSTIPSGQSRFTVFYTSAGGQPIDVLVDDEVFVSALAFPGTLDGNDGSASFTVLAGDYDIAVTANGDPETVLTSLEGFAMQPGGHYFIGVINSTDVTTFVQTLSASEISAAR